MRIYRLDVKRYLQYIPQVVDTMEKKEETRRKTSVSVLPSLWRQLKSSADALDLSDADALDAAVRLWLDNEAARITQAFPSPML